MTATCGHSSETEILHRQVVKFDSSGNIKSINGISNGWLAGSLISILSKSILKNDFLKKPLEVGKQNAYSTV